MYYIYFNGTEFYVSDQECDDLLRYSCINESKAIKLCDRLNEGVSND